LETLVFSTPAPLETLASTVSHCQACALACTRTQTVFSDGNPTAKLFIIGEAPGQQEDETGTPFVGRAGKLLTHLLETVGINRSTDVYIANILKCRPPNNRKPLPTEVVACKSFLIQQIQLVQPQLLILAGSTAVEGILGIKTPISKLRGTVMDSPLGIPAMPIFHPSYLLRNPLASPEKPKGLTLADLSLCKQLVSV
jgi:uracil-DNA glycosylase family 4